VTNINSAAGNGENPQVHQFKGCSDLKGKQTGFSHAERVEGRWWIVDPEGNVFLSLGINHVKPDLLALAYNRAHSEKKYGPLPVPFSIEAFKETDGWPIWLDTLRQDFQEWGFNTLGGLSSPEARPAELPYTINLCFCDICHWTPVPQVHFPDVFSESFEAHCDCYAKQVCKPVAEDPMLVGYFYIDCPILTEESAGKKVGNLYWDMVRGQTPTWPSAIRSLRGYQPGKKVYVHLVKERYGSIAAFNRFYGTNCESFYTLFQRDMSEVVPVEADRAAKDDEALLALILQRYYEVTRNAIRRYDPHHLILGDRYNGNTHVPSVAIEAMKAHVDVFSVQYYGFFEEQREALEQWHRDSGKPMLLCDSAYSVPDENMPNPFGPHVESQKERAKAYEEYARAVFALPYVVGWHHCGYMDQWSVAQGPRQHSGIKDVFENQHQPFVNTLRRVNRELYRVAKNAS